MLQLLAVEAFELRGEELEVVGPEREGLHLREAAHRPRGRREVEVGAAHQCPGKQLLPAEVSVLQGDGVEEARSPAIRGGALKLPPDDEEHLVHGVPLAHNVRALCVEGRDEALAYRVEELVVHLGEEGDLIQS